MRYCAICGKAMHTSWNGFWLKNKRYQAHVPCEKKVIEDALQKAVDEGKKDGQGN